MSECTCPPTAQLLTDAIAGREAPSCEVHRPTPNPSSAGTFALNDSEAIARTLGMPLVEGSTL